MEKRWGKSRNRIDLESETEKNLMLQDMSNLEGSAHFCLCPLRDSENAKIQAKKRGW